MLLGNRKMRNNGARKDIHKDGKIEADRSGAKQSSKRAANAPRCGARRYKQAPPNQS